MVNFSPLTAEIGLGVWGTPANFNGFRVLAALLHSSSSSRRQPNCGVEQRALPVFCRAVIPLGTGPHSSLSSCFLSPVSTNSVVKELRVKRLAVILGIDLLKSILLVSWVREMRKRVECCLHKDGGLGKGRRYEY